MDEQKYNQISGYCRKLGHHLKFEYCRTEQGNAPCTRILDCWFEKFDVQAFMAEHHPSKADTQRTATIPNKAQTLVELIALAQQRAAAPKS